MKIKKICSLLSIVGFLCLSSCSFRKNNSEQEQPSEELTYTVSFDSRGGSNVAPIVVKKGEKVNKPTDPTKDDFTFNGWYTGQSLETLFDFNTPIVKDWILFAGWKDKEFTVTFNSLGGSQVSTITVKKGQTITKPADPTKQGDIFDGWYTEQTLENLFDFSTPILSDLTLYAGWRHNLFVVTFDSQGGSAVASVKVEKDQTVVRPEDPTKNYCTFTGWYTEQTLENLFDFATPITHDLTLYAGWEENPRNIKLKIAVFADIQLSAKENVYDSSTDTYTAYANAGNTVHAYISLKNHFELCKEQNVDVILMNGDIVNNAVTNYYDLYEEALQSVYGTDESLYPEIIYNMGNHEWWDLQEHETANAVSLFNQHARIGDVVHRTTVTYYLDNTATLPTYYKLIGDDVPFLVISGENSAGQINNIMKGEIQTWLNEISQLPSVQNGGPIYVLYHYPLHTSLTHGNNAQWTAETLEDLLKDYPQAIVFTGDTHYSGVNERAINQVDFTTINIGSSSYSRMDKMSATMTPDEHFYNMKIKGGKTSDELMGDVNYKHEYTPTIHLMNNFDNLDTTIDRYFSTDDKEHPIHINQTWEIPRGTNKSNFKYTNARFGDVNAAKALYGADGVSWSNSAQLKFGVKNGKMTVIVPNTIEYHYTEHFKIEVTGNSKKTYDVVGNYYRYDLSPEDMYFFLEDLPAGDNYSVKVTAYDYFDNPSLNYLTSDTNDLTCCADEVDNKFTGAYTESSNHLYYDDHVENSNTSIEYYYNGVKRNEYGSPLGQLIRDKVPGKTDGGVNISEYLSIGNQDHCEVILKAKIKNLSDEPLVFGYTLYATDYAYKPASTQNNGQVVPANSDWVSLEWNITKQYADVVGRESVTFLALIVSADGYGYDEDGYEMHFLLDDMDVAAGAYANVPETATRYNLEMCTYSPGQWRGEGSAAEVTFVDTFGANSTSARKITFAESNNLPETNTPTSAATVNASFDLAQSASIGKDAGIDANHCTLSFDVKFSNEFFTSENNYRNRFTVKIEDSSWHSCTATLDIVDSVSNFTYENTNNGWIHIEYNLFEVGALEDLGTGTMVVTLGFFGISNATRTSAYVVLDNIALTDLPPGEFGEKETASRFNLEMCNFEPGAWRGTGSEAKICYDDLYGASSTSARRITFKNSENLVGEMTSTDTHTVNASFNLATTTSIGHPNDIKAKDCTLSFDIKLSQEFFDSINSYKHQFTLKIEDETWHSESVWIPMKNYASEMTYENTENGWIHVSYDLSQKPTLVNNLGDETYVITFGFFGITNTTRATASIVLDNIALTANS